METSCTAVDWYICVWQI